MTLGGKKTFAGGGGRHISPLPFHTEIDITSRGMAFLVSGVTGIRDFSSECAVLRIRGFLLRICGEQLSLTVYENKTVEIVGKITEVEFLYDKA